MFCDYVLRASGGTMWLEGVDGATQFLTYQPSPLLSIVCEPFTVVINLWTICGCG